MSPITYSMISFIQQFMAATRSLPDALKCSSMNQIWYFISSYGLQGFFMMAQRFSRASALLFRQFFIWNQRCDYLLVVVFFEPVAFQRYLMQLSLQFFDLLHVFFIFLLEDGHVLFLALPGDLGGLAVAFELLILGDGRLIVFEVRVGGIVVDWVDLFSRFEQLCHFVAVEHLLLVLASAPAALSLQARHPLIPFQLVAIFLAAPPAEMLQKVGTILHRSKTADKLPICLRPIALALHVMRNNSELYIRHQTYLVIVNNQQPAMRKIKAGKRGEVIKYVSRAKAIKKLQLSLKDFRRMCILKGVYPREPPKKLKKTSRTYYHLKDINFLALDPIIDRIRSQKVYLKKFKKAKAKGDIGKIQYLAKHKPKISLNHLVRERYPQFVDALRDLDDPLSLMALFTIFPTHKEFNLSGEKIELCSKLLRHFQLYVIRTNSLKKVFVSIKGVYYQSQIMGQNITYIVPFKYPANLPIDVDYRVMSTFLDFYIVLMKFVNYKLYLNAGLQYPPVQEDVTTYQGYSFNPIKADDNEEERYKIDEEFKNKEIENKNLLFANLKFYLSTEVPRYSLQFVILAFGGQVSLEDNDATITHVITDRENIARQKTKEYIQPQWVYDSVNFNRLLNVKEYQIGKPLPPHLSPFVNENDTERHIPEREKELRGIAQKIEEEQAEDDQEENKYDIIAESKKKLESKKKEQKEFAQISKNIMSNKNRKLLKVIEKSRKDKSDVEEKLKSKSKALKSK